MKNVVNHLSKSIKLWNANYNEIDQSMELSFKEGIKDSDISCHLQHINNLVNFFPVKKLIINNSKIDKNPLRLDWKIIEVSWEAIYRNGGGKIVVIHQSHLPSSLTEAYTDAVKTYGLPVKLEFKSTNK